MRDDPHHLGESALAKIAESGKYPLDPWELEFCRWLAANRHARFKEQCAVATKFAGTDIDVVKIRQLKARKNFRGTYQQLVSRILHRLDKHREQFETENVGKAIKAHSWAIDQAMAKEDYKAIPALMEPATKAMYKHIDESVQKPMIVLNLGGFQQQHLDDPPEEIEFEEVKQLPSGEHDGTT